MMIRTYWPSPQVRSGARFIGRPGGMASISGFAALKGAHRADIGSVQQGFELVATIYKICEQALWRAAEAAGQFSGSPADAHDGFIHFSTGAQLAETAAKHYAGQSELLLIGVDAEVLGGALKWERSRGGNLFPHLYAPLPLRAVRSVRPLPDEVGGRRALPELDP
jgi:uncharacterized protein (DUF952 family)